MKTLAEMTTGELWGLMADVDRAVRGCEIAGAPTAELQKFRGAIDAELDRRGA